MFTSKTRFLIVDDSAPTLELIKEQLNNLGYRNVTGAVDGREAYQSMLSAKVAGSDFEFVISDWNMPNLDGIALLKLVRSRPEWSRLPFVLLTTENEKSKILQAVLATASSYLVKPSTEEQLKNKILTVWQKMNSSAHK